MMNQKLIFFLAATVSIVLLVIFVFGARTVSQSPIKEAPLSSKITQSQVMESGNLATEISPLPLPSHESSQQVSSEPLPPDEEIERLQEFLDNNDNDAIVEQARFLIESDDYRRCSEAVDALVWVATPKAGLTLLPLLETPDEEISDEAFNAMVQILVTISTHIYDDPTTGELVMVDMNEGGIGLNSEELQQAYDLWVSACQAVNNVGDLETLLIPLVGLDVKFSVPVLVDVLEGTKGSIKQKVAEYLDMATNGNGVTTREEAMLWLLEQEEKK